MSNYREILFKHLDGIVLIPTIIGLKKTGILNSISNKISFSINEINENNNFNVGYLNISLRTLRNCNLLKFKENKYYLDSRYKVTNNFKKIINSFNYMDEISRLISFYLKSNKLSNQDIKDYSKLIINLIKIFNKNDLDSKILTIYLEGILLGPIFAKYSFEKRINIYKDKIKITNTDKNLEKSINLLFESLDIIKNNKITDKGLYFINKASAYGVTVSYLNTLDNIEQLLTTSPSYIWNRREDNTEIHVDRSLNVWGSGGAHKNYFKKIDKTITSIFNKPLDNQPQGIIDIGCGDGTFLKHLYELISNNTLRGKHLNKNPLYIVGTDINEKARIATTITLKNIDHIVLYGDISNPDELNKNLYTKYNFQLSNLLNCRTFLDHNRIYKKPSKYFLQHNINSNGSFTYKGRLINSKDLIANFIEHLYKWKPYIKKYGLIIIELHTIDSEITRLNSGKTLACSYDATHGYTDQYLIEYNNYKECFNEIGLKNTSKNEYLFPKKNPTVSINYFIE